MKTAEEIKAMRDELAKKYSNSPFYENFLSYAAGFDAAFELMLERERKAIEALKFTVGCTRNLLCNPEEKGITAGLSPEFYHTLTYEGDMKLRDKYFEAKETLNNLTKVGK